MHRDLILSRYSKLLPYSAWVSAVNPLLINFRGVDKVKNYDCEKVTAFINEHKEEIESVTLGMHEDWFWTAETVWENGEYADDYKGGLNGKTEIAGIKGSSWATPSMRIDYKDGTEKHIPCYVGESERDSAPYNMLGALSGPVQANMPPLEDE